MSFQQGLSGLNAASRNLDVIGNNIANANTVGMKTSRAEFAELYAASVNGAGGTGLGVEVEKVSQQFTQGNISVTGNNLDVAINGGGFFKLQQTDGTPAYTRAGNFKLDKEGNLVTNGGAKVMGTMISGPDADVRTRDVPLSFPTGAPIGAKQTVGITAVINLDARTQSAAILPLTPRSTFGTSINVHDAQGVVRPVNLYFEKAGTNIATTANTWNVFDKLNDPTATPAFTASPLGTVTFDSNGKFVSTIPALPAGNTTPGPLVTTVNVSPANPNTPVLNPTPPATATTFNVNISLAGSTQFGGQFSVSELKQDGYARGNLTSINIANDGKVMANYSNGVSRPVAEIALASFRNPQGLAPGGGNLWTETSGSGPATSPSQPGTSNLGMLRSGALEDSNVDLTSELVSMMVAQRAYQANAQTIKTQDQVLSTLLNMR
jgi:flagellar hook protein FlgE